VSILEIDFLCGNNIGDGVLGEFIVSLPGLHERMAKINKDPRIKLVFWDFKSGDAFFYSVLNKRKR